MRIPLLAVCALLLAAYAPSAVAQTPATTDATTVDTVIVTGRRTVVFS